MSFTLFIFHIAFEALVAFRGSLSFLHTPLHVLYKFGQLTVFFIFFLEGDRHFLIFGLHLANHCISLLEFLFNYLKLLRVSEGILRADNLFELVAQAGTFFHVELDFNLNFLLASTAYITLQCLYFIKTTLVFVLSFLNFSLQIYDQVGVSFEGASEAVTLEFWRRLWQSIISLLL